jgi:hypothetical protein
LPAGLQSVTFKNAKGCVGKDLTLPPSLRTLRCIGTTSRHLLTFPDQLQQLKLCCSVNLDAQSLLDALPATLRRLYLSGCNAIGRSDTVAKVELPALLTHLSLHNVTLRGGLQRLALPSTLTHLSIGRITGCGSQSPISLADFQWPVQLQWLDFSMAKTPVCAPFAGPLVDFPDTIKHLALDCRFRDLLPTLSLPRRLSTLSLAEGLCLTQLPQTIEHLQLGNGLHLLLDSKRLPPALRSLHVDHDYFDSAMCLADFDLPSTLRQVKIGTLSFFAEDKQGQSDLLALRWKIAHHCAMSSTLKPMASVERQYVKISKQ